MDKCYSKAIEFETFEERLEYLKLKGVSYESPRAISPSFYKSKRWRDVRETVLRRDLGCDLGVFGVYIYGFSYVHHINPITEEDIENDSPKLYDPENLITVSLDTHNIIHYRQQPTEPYLERTPGDTNLW